jgi:hypothetical protein
MTRKNSHPISDIERPQPTVADSFGDDIAGEPIPVRLGEIWSDYIRGAGDNRAPDVPRSPSSLPLIDDMKGILQWE